VLTYTTHTLKIIYFLLSKGQYEDVIRIRLAPDKVQ